MQRVVIVGGTHGNELNGIYLYHKWQQSDFGVNHPFQVEFCLANPQAMAACRRYLDQDLNRSFKPEDLNNPELSAYEAQRAKELAQALSGADFLLDLHNTTSNMGLALILSRAEALDDPLMRQLCAHLQKSDPLVSVYFMPNASDNNPYLPSVAKRDLTLEVGPLAHGTLGAELFFRTEALVQCWLNFLADWDKGQAPSYTGALTVYEFVRNLDYPRDANGLLTAMIHPQLQGQDFEPLAPGAPLFMDLNGSTLPFESQETLWPVFINEQAYYEKHMALSLTRKISVSL